MENVVAAASLTPLLQAFKAFSTAPEFNQRALMADCPFHVRSAMWAAFEAGWTAAKADAGRTTSSKLDR